MILGILRRKVKSKVFVLSGEVPVTLKIVVVVGHHHYVAIGQFGNREVTLEGSFFFSPPSSELIVKQVLKRLGLPEDYAKYLTTKEI